MEDNFSFVTGLRGLEQFVGDLQSGLLALRHENEDDISDVNVRNSHNSAVKLCSSALPRLCPNHIIMTILRLELNACTDLSSIRRICVCFQFLTDYCERDDQCTPLVSNNRAVLNFSFSSGKAP